MAKRTLSPLIGAAAVLLLSACADGPGYSHRDHASLTLNYDGYYDDFYGPINDGYWGPGGVFYFSDAPGHPYRRDDGHHVRRDAANGFHTIHGHHNPPAAGGDRDHR